MYEVIDGLVYEVKEIETETQTAVIRKQVHDVIYNEETEEFENVETSGQPVQSEIDQLKEEVQSLKEDNLTLMMGIKDIYEKLGGGD